MENIIQQEIDNFFDKTEIFTDSIGKDNVEWNDYSDGDSVTHVIEDKRNDNGISITIDVEDKAGEEYYQNKKSIFERNIIIDDILPTL